MNFIRRGKMPPTVGGIIRTTVTLGLAVWIAYGQLPDAANPATVSEPGGSIIAGRMAVASFANEMIFNAAAGNVIKLTLRDNVTSSTIANTTVGQFLTLLLCQDAAGSRSFVAPTNMRLSGGAFTLTRTPLQCDALTVVFDGITWYEIARVMNE